MFFSEGCHSRALGSDPPNFAKVQLDHGNSKRLFQLWISYNQKIIADSPEVVAFVDWLASIGKPQSLQSDYQARTIALVMALADHDFFFTTNGDNDTLFNKDYASLLGQVYNLAYQLSLAINLDLKDIIENAKKRDVRSIAFIDPFLLMDKVDKDERFQEFSSMINSALIEETRIYSLKSFSDTYIIQKENIHGMIIFWYSIVWAVELIRNYENVGVSFITKNIRDEIIGALENISYHDIDSTIANVVMRFIQIGGSKISWNQVSERIRSIVFRCNNVGIQLDIPIEQLKCLGKYIRYTHTMIDCLAVAYIDDRGHVLNSILTVSK